MERKMYSTLCILVLLSQFLVACSPVSAGTVSQIQDTLFVGDSISWGAGHEMPGYSIFVQRELSRDILTRRLPYNALSSYEHVLLVDDWISNHPSIDTVFINSGAWDMLLQRPLEDYEANIRCVFSRLQSAGIKVVFLSSVVQGTGPYNIVAHEVVAEMGIDVIRLDIWGFVERWQTVDGIHYDANIAKRQGEIIADWILQHNGSN